MSRDSNPDPKRYSHARLAGKVAGQAGACSVLCPCCVTSEVQQYSVSMPAVPTRDHGLVSALPKPASKQHQT